MDAVDEEHAPTARAAGFLAGGLAVVATAWYLAPGFPWALLNLAFAVGILLWPLRRPWPLSRQRLIRVLVWWLVAGLLGAYVFGVFVFVAGLAVAVALLVESRLSGRRSAT